MKKALHFNITAKSYLSELQPQLDPVDGLLAPTQSLTFDVSKVKPMGGNYHIRRGVYLNPTDWVIYGVASTDDVDLVDDVVNAEEVFSDYLEEFVNTGRIFWEHGYKMAGKADPETMVDIPLGIPYLAEIYENKLWLYILLDKTHPQAIKVWNKINTSDERFRGQIGLSIGALPKGKTTTVKHPTKGMVKKAPPMQLYEVSITGQPINPFTWAQVVKSFMEENMDEDKDLDMEDTAPEEDTETDGTDTMDEGAEPMEDETEELDFADDEGDMGNDMAAGGDAAGDDMMGGAPGGAPGGAMDAGAMGDDMGGSPEGAMGGDDLGGDDLGGDLGGAPPAPGGAPGGDLGGLGGAPGGDLVGAPAPVAAPGGDLGGLGGAPGGDMGGAPPTMEDLFNEDSGTGNSGEAEGSTDNAINLLLDKLDMALDQLSELQSAVDQSAAGMDRTDVDLPEAPEDNPSVPQLEQEPMTDIKKSLQESLDKQDILIEIVKSLGDAVADQKKLVMSLNSKLKSLSSELDVFKTAQINSSKSESIEDMRSGFNPKTKSFSSNMNSQHPGFNDIAQSLSAEENLDLILKDDEKTEILSELAGMYKSFSGQPMQVAKKHEEIFKAAKDYLGLSKIEFKEVVNKIK